MEEIKIDLARNGGAVAVDMRFKTLDQLFDASDPIPVSGKGVDRYDRDTIFESFIDVSLRKDVDLVVHIPEGSVPPESKDQLANAVRRHFSFRLDDLAREKKSSWREGKVSVQIAIATLAFSIVVFYLYSIRSGTDFAFQLMIGIFIIINWVTIWHTYGYFVYDHRKLWRKYRVYAYLTRVNVVIRQTY